MFSDWENKLFLKVLRTRNSDLLTTIYRRSRFYLWFYLYIYKKKLKIRWPLAAYAVAKSVQQLVVEFIGLKNEELELFMYRGNQMIFDDVLPKLISALNDDELIDEQKARLWDGRILWEEQHLIQPLYTELSNDSLTILENLTKGTRFLGFPIFFAKLNPLTNKHTKVDLLAFKKSFPHINHEASIPMFPKRFPLIYPLGRYIYGFIVANAIFKEKVSAPNYKTANLRASYQLKIRRQGIRYSNSHDRVRLKDQIHLLRSVLNNYTATIDGIELILNSFRHIKGVELKKHKHILNYDMYFIQRIAFLEVYFNNRVKSLKSLLRPKIRKRYLNEYKRHLSDKEIVTYGHGMENM